MAEPHDTTRKPTIAITMGDPAGIGPEIIVKALADPAIRRMARYVIYGLNELLTYAADLAEIEPFWYRVPQDSDRHGFDLTHDVIVLDYDEYSMLGQAVHQPTREGGAASYRFVCDAIDAAMRPAGAPNRIDGIVTAPICKESWHLAGKRKHPGHTELLRSRTGAKRSVMLFDSPKLRVALATIHLPLMDIRNVLTIGRVYDPIDLGHDYCRSLGIDRPRIAVCGLNPHASEGGLFGDEESRLIEPAIRTAREQGIDVRGPFPADTIFAEAVDGAYDLVVAMYHDQGLIPVKLLAFDTAVNVTLGLPIIRTSPDHGTAFDIVGKNRAKPEPFGAAIRRAVRLTAAADRAKT